MTRSADAIIALIRAEGLEVQWLLDNPWSIVIPGSYPCLAADR